MVSVVRFFSAPNRITFELRPRLAACAVIESPRCVCFGGSVTGLYSCVRVYYARFGVSGRWETENWAIEVTLRCSFSFFSGTRKLCLSTQLSRRVPDTVTNYFLRVGILKKKV